MPRPVLAALLSALLAGPAAADLPVPDSAVADSAVPDSAVAVTPVGTPTTAADGDPILLPQGPAQALVATYEIAAAARLPVHKHPFPRMAYVLSGTLVVTEGATGAETAYDAGQFAVEMVDAWHWGRNDGAGPLRLLVIDLVPEGQSNTILQAP